MAKTANTLSYMGKPCPDRHMASLRYILPNTRFAIAAVP